jgi:tetratricopeptide (TPR) repeat protein
VLFPLASLAFGAVVGALFGWLLGHWGFGVAPGILAAIGMLWYLSRVVLRDVNARAQRVQELLTPKSPTAQMNVKAKLDEAIAQLRPALRWDRYVPFVAPQIHSQIGQLLYMDKRFEEAERHLAAGSDRNWIGVAMLASIHYRRKRYDDMKAALERAVKYSPREALLWNLWAWFLNGNGDRSGAIEVLVRAQKHVANDERTRKNLEALQNGKGVKLRGWDMMWYQFLFEVPQQAMPQPQFARRATARGR